MLAALFSIGQVNRGRQASAESPWLNSIMRTVMAEALSLDTISETETPALTRLLVKAFNTGEQSTLLVKESQWRTRPFMQMNDSLWALYDTNFLRTNSSCVPRKSCFAAMSMVTIASLWVIIGPPTSKPRVNSLRLSWPV